MDWLKIVKIEALHAVIKEDPEYVMRDIQRWYSEKFHTPLHVVEEELDFDRVAKHFFEVKFQEMRDEEREEELKLLTETDAERIERLRKEESNALDDDEFLRQTIAETKQAAEKVKNLVNAIKPGSEPEPIIPVPIMGTSIPQTFAEPEAPIAKLPEGIEMQFSDEEAGEDWDLFGPPRPQK